MSKFVMVSHADAVCHVHLNRPAKANSLTGEMLEAMIGAVASASSVSNVLVFTGEGSVFSAGADLDEARSGLATSPSWEKFSSAVAEFPGLTIASLNGTVAGGAMGMMLACDIRLAVPEARFFYPVMKLGFLPQRSDPVRLAALVGHSRAAMILLAGQKIDAAEALSWGLVDRVVPREELEPETSRLLQDALSADRSHLTAIKSMFRQRRAS